MRLAAAQVTKLSSQIATVQSHSKTVHQSVDSFSKRLAKDFDKGVVEFCRQLLLSARDTVATRCTGVEKTAKDSMEPFKRILHTVEGELDKKMPNAE